MSSGNCVTKSDENCNEMNVHRAKPRPLTSAERVRAFRQRQQRLTEYPALPQGPYRILYADPPWQYENDGLKKYGHAASHYDTLSIDNLRQLPIKALAEQHAVLFLWVTAPMSLACAPVIEAWGFTFKTQLVWDKMRHNFGYYVGIQHELLYICTRGRCRPDVHDLVGSVRRCCPDVHDLDESVHRIPRTQHSTKPKAFRDLIDMLYPEGRRLELFAREQSVGWDTWGNEVRANKEVFNGTS